MADTQNQIWAQAYGTNIIQLAQQQGSKLLSTVWQKPNVTGKNFFQDRIGQWTMKQKGGRNVQTPNSDPNLSRRMGILVDYHDNVLLDRGDAIRTISDPKSAYTIAGGNSIGRQIDDVIIAAAVGPAYSGETGSTTVTISNSRIITAGSLTLADVVAIKALFDATDVPAEDRYIVVNPTTMGGLMSVTQATSSDYNTVKALVRGEINTWMGFTWIVSTRLALYSSATVTAGTIAGIAYQKTGICVAGADGSPMVRTDERTDLSYSWQLYYEVDLGAVRLEEEKVVKICTA